MSGNSMNRTSRRGETFVEWSAEDTAAALEMWRQGLSSGIIATKMGKTRNQVIGKVMRATKKGDVPKRSTISLSKTVQRRAKRPLENRAQDMPKDFIPLNISMMDIGRSQCHWPMWLHAKSGWPDFSLCGLATITGPYCKNHMKIALSAKVT